MANVLVAVQAHGVPGAADTLDDRWRALGAGGDGEERRRHAEAAEQIEQAGGPHGIGTVVEGERDAVHLSLGDGAGRRAGHRPGERVE